MSSKGKKSPSHSAGRPFAVAAAIVAIVSVFALCCLSSSPLFPEVEFDSSVFQIMGEGWLKGKIPYVDLFDHKGPAIYLINAAAIVISPAWGLFLLEWLNLLCAFCLMYKIGACLTPRPGVRLMALAFTALFLSYFIEGGNFSESWSLCFILLPVYMLFEGAYAARSPFAVFSPRLMLVTGLCFGVITLQRVNNGAILVAIGVTMVLMLGALGEWRRMLAGIAAAFAGFMVAVVPMAAYFAWHGALSEMWFGIIGFNLEYSAFRSATLSAMRHSAVKLIPIMVMMTMMASRKVRLPGAVRLFIAVACLLSIAVITSVIAFNHYFIIITPLVYIMCVLMFRTSLSPLVKGLAMLLALGVFISLYELRLMGRKAHHEITALCSRPLTTQSLLEAIPLLKEVGYPRKLHDLIVANVPPACYDSIYSLHLKGDDIAVYCKLRATPPARHFYFQQWHSLISPEVQSCIMEDMRNLSAPFVLTLAPSRSPGFPPPECLRTLREDYEPVGTAGEIVLYRRRRGK